MFITFGSQLCCFTDLDELIVYFLPSDVIRLLREYEEYVEMIHLSDENILSALNTTDTPRKLLRFKFKLPALQEDLTKLMNLALKTLDLVNSMK